MTRLAVVLWSGLPGGAETFTVDLCRAMRALHAPVGVVFVTGSEPLRERLDAAEIPYASLGLDRGREVMRHPRALAMAVRELGPDGAVVPRAGYLTAALRVGGYRGRVVAVAHDAVFDLGPVSRRERVSWRIDRATGFWASDIDVAVSDFGLLHMRRQLHARRLVRIYNGVDLDVYDSRPGSPERRPVTVATAARFVKGKGIDVLLRAFAQIASHGLRLRIAGDGPMRSRLANLASELGLDGAVEFTGSITDISSFWRGCDVAVQPSDTFVESFGMAAVEAMACAKPVVATANGALPEVVDDGVTGSIIAPGDVHALSTALLALARDHETRRSFGTAGRLRCEQRFDIRDTAASYLSLFGEGSGAAVPGPARR